VVRPQQPTNDEKKLRELVQAGAFLVEGLLRGRWDLREDAKAWLDAVAQVGSVVVLAPKSSMDEETSRKS
jgi:hypothetical protein